MFPTPRASAAATWVLQYALRTEGESLHTLTMTAERQCRKISFPIFGTKISLKVPKVKIFKRTAINHFQEPEWHWQAGEGSTNYVGISTEKLNHVERQKVSSGESRQKAEKQQHKFLNFDQVATIHAWLDRLPDPGYHLLISEEEVSFTEADYNQRSQVKSSKEFRTFI